MEPDREQPAAEVEKLTAEAAKLMAQARRFDRARRRRVRPAIAADIDATCVTFDYNDPGDAALISAGHRSLRSDSHGGPVFPTWCLETEVAAPARRRREI